MQHVRFLVVDDSPTVISVVSSALVNRLGAEKIYTAKNGQEALEIIETRDIDIIISDWEMPLLNGIELLRHVRKHHKINDIPFIMMTARGDRDHVVSAVQQGVSHYVVKPFSADKLEDAINKSWNGAKKRSSVRLSGLPPHTVCLYTPQGKLAPRVKNISKTGVLLQLPYDEQLKLFYQYQLDIKLHELSHDNTYSINKLTGKVIRIEADDVNDSDAGLCNVALSFVNDVSSGQSQTALKLVLEYLSIDIPQIIDN
jgi:two-component system, chemotaxis family, chemotaxis protein CheY